MNEGENEQLDSRAEDLVDANIGLILDSFKPLPIKALAGGPMLPEIDSDELCRDGGSLASIPINELLLIEYQDGRGNRSVRRITVKYIVNKSDGDCDMWSYCHEREAYRMFLLSRVEKITYIQTGETIENPLINFKGKYGDPDRIELNKVMKLYEDEILCLVFIGRSDGVLRKSERAIIEKYIFDKAGFKKENKRWSIDNEIRNMNCLVDDFRKGIKRMALTKTTKEKNVLIDYIKSIISADKVEDPMERAGLVVMEKIFQLN